MHSHLLFLLPLLPLTLSAATPSPPPKCVNDGTCVAVPAVWDGFGYLFNASVGGQDLTLLSDWTWSSLFVRSGRCLDQFNPLLCVDPSSSGQTWFDETRSLTFENSSLPRIRWPTTAFAPNFTVDYGVDTVCVGSICSPDTVLQLSDFPYPATAIPKVPFAGIFGMAPVTPGLGPDMFPAAYQAWKGGKMGPRTGWNSCAALSSSEPCLGGEAKFVFGGIDGSLFRERDVQTFVVRNPDWLGDAFYPLRPPRNNYWSTEVTGNWILFPSRNQQEQPSSPNMAMAPVEKKAPGSSISTYGLLDEGSEGLAAPLSLKAYQWLVSHITSASPASHAVVAAIAAQGSSGFNMAHQDWFTVPCDGYSRQYYPDLVYELDGRANYTIRPNDYIVELREMPSVCYLSINVWKNGRLPSGDARVLLLGGAFLKRLYVVLDFEMLSFSLAPLRNVTS